MGPSSCPTDPCVSLLWGDHHSIFSLFKLTTPMPPALPSVGDLALNVTGRRGFKRYDSLPSLPQPCGPIVFVLVFAASLLIPEGHDPFLLRGLSCLLCRDPLVSALSKDSNPLLCPFPLPPFRSLPISSQTGSRVLLLYKGPLWVSPHPLCPQLLSRVSSSHLPEPLPAPSKRPLFF